MTKARDREEERCTFLGPVCSNRVSVSRITSGPAKLGKICPLPRLTLGRRTTPAAGPHRAPSRVTMRLVVISRPMERTEDDGRRRLTCPL
jgi:hypothetical protein